MVASFLIWELVSTVKVLAAELLFPLWCCSFIWILSYWRGDGGVVREMRNLVFSVSGVAWNLGVFWLYASGSSLGEWLHLVQWSY